MSQAADNLASHIVMFLYGGIAINSQIPIHGDEFDQNLSIFSDRRDRDICCYVIFPWKYQQHFPAGLELVRIDCIADSAEQVRPVQQDVSKTPALHVGR